MSMQRQALSIIKSFFASLSSAERQYQSLVGKPVVAVTPGKVIVQLFYMPGLGSSATSTDILSNASIAALGDALTRC